MPEAHDMKQLSDSKLYNDYLRGDNEAYDQLMIRYGDSLTLYLYGYLHDWHDAEDQMIETFARIMVKRPRIGDGNFKAYLYKIGRNLAYRYYSKRHRVVEFSLDEYGDDSAGGELVEQSLINDERRQVLHICLDRIEPQLKEALWLVYFEEMSYREAADIMGVNTKRIDHLLTRGKRKLREELEKEGVTDANG